MDIQQFEAMLRRRGYTGTRCLEERACLTCYQHYSFDSGIFYAYSLLEIELFAAGPAALIDVTLGKGQHHMMCGQCGLPVLEHICSEVRVIPWLRFPGPSTLEPSPSISVEYRLVSAGPESGPVTVCPQCGGELQQTAREIED